VTAQVLPALAIMILLLYFMPGRAGYPVAPVVWNDLGNLLLTFLVLHAYMSFGQWLIIWNGNEPSEVLFYESRIHGAWGILLLIDFFSHFVLPFFALIFRPLKRRPEALVTIASVVLAGCLVDTAWVVLPSPFFGGARSGAWLALFAVLAAAGVGGLAFFVLFRALPRFSMPRPLPAEGDAA